MPEQIDLVEFAGSDADVASPQRPCKKAKVDGLDSAGDGEEEIGGQAKDESDKSSETFHGLPECGDEQVASVEVEEETADAVEKTAVVESPLAIGGFVLGAGRRYSSNDSLKPVRDIPPPPIVSMIPSRCWGRAQMPDGEREIFYGLDEEDEVEEDVSAEVTSRQRLRCLRCQRLGLVRVKAKIAEDGEDVVGGVMSTDTIGCGGRSSSTPPSGDASRAIDLQP